jgi:hypothetical protein
VNTLYNLLINDDDDNNNNNTLLEHIPIEDIRQALSTVLNVASEARCVYRFQTLRRTLLERQLRTLQCGICINAVTHTHTHTHTLVLFYIYVYK